MAVTLTIEAVRRLIRAPSADQAGAGSPWAADGGLTHDLQALLDFAKLEIEAWAPDAPEAAANEAARRLIGYSVQRGSFAVNVSGEVIDRPGTGGAYMLYSGAAAALQRWHPIRAEAVEE